MGVTKGDFQDLGIDVDVILGNCTKPFVTIYIFVVVFFALTDRASTMLLLLSSH